MIDILGIPMTFLAIRTRTFIAIIIIEFLSHKLENIAIDIAEATSENKIKNY